MDCMWISACNNNTEHKLKVWWSVNKTLLSQVWKDAVLQSNVAKQVKSQCLMMQMPADKLIRV